MNMRGLTLLLMLVLLSANAHAQPAAPEPILTLGRGEIVSAAWAPDGQSIWISTTAGTWQLDTALHEIAAYPHITYAALSPDGTHLAGISSDGIVGLWNTATGSELWKREHPSGTPSVPVWSPDGSRFTHSQHGFLLVELVHNRTAANMFTSFDLRSATTRYIAWSASGRYLAAYVNGDGIWVIDVVAQQRILLENHELAFDQGTSFLIWRGDGQLEWLSLGDGLNGYSWLLPGGEKVESIPGPYYYGYSHSPDGQYSAGIGIMTLSMVHISTKMPVYEGPNIHYQTPAWSPDSRRLAVVQSDWRDHSIQAVVVFDPFASGEVWRQDQVGYTADRLIWNETGTHLLVVGLGRIALLDGETGEIFYRNENFREFSLAAPDSSAQHIAVADTFGDVLIVDIKRGDKIDEVAGYTFPIIELAWQPQGDTLAILNYLSSPSSGQIQLWQFDTNSASGTFNLPESSLDDLWAVDIAWNSDGSSLAIASSRLIRLFGAHQGTFDLIDPDDPLNEVHIYEVRWTRANEPVARYYKCCHRPPTLKNTITGISSFVSERAWQLSPSGEIVTTGLGRTFAIESYPMTISIHRVSESGRTTLTLDDRTQYLAHHWISPLTTQVAAIDASGSGLVWDATTGQPLDFLANVHDLVWTPDDSALAVLRRDGSLWLQNAGGLRLLWSPIIPVRAPGTLVWSGDGSTLAHTQDGVLRVWKVQ